MSTKKRKLGKRKPRWLPRLPPTINAKQVVIGLLPYILIAWVGDKLGWLYRYCPGNNLLSRLMVLLSNAQMAFGQPFISFHPRDLLVGVAAAKQIGNPFGVAGLMGNLKAESALRSINLQQSYEKKLGYTDDSYTDAVDSGKYSKFASDAAGYGLAQWTSGGRKKNLLAYAKETNSSIGNLQMQLEFLMQELRGSYKAVLSVLKNANSVREASDAVLLKFEIPANRGDSVQLKRASYGEAYYDQYVGIAVETPAETIKKGSKGAAVKDMQKLLLRWKPDCLPKYGVDGDWGTETDDALRAFQAAAGVPANGIYDETTEGLLKGWGTVKYVTVNAGKSVNVRSKADTTGKILGVAHGGDKLPYVATADTGWYNIMYNGVSAFISNKYSRIG